MNDIHEKSPRHACARRFIQGPVSRSVKPAGFRVSLVSRQLIRPTILTYRVFVSFFEIDQFEIYLI